MSRFFLSAMEMSLTLGTKAEKVRIVSDNGCNPKDMLAVVPELGAIPGN
jgi:hypothetical protein